MIIGVDGNEANTQKKVGVSVYTFELIHYFYKQADQNTRFEVYLRESPRDDMPSENDFFKYKIISGRFLWSQFFFPLYLFTHSRPDILFCPAHYAPRISPVKTIVAVHDLAYYYFPEEFLKKDFYKLSNWTNYSVQNATHVIAVSKTTARDLNKFYSLRENKISVIYNGYKVNPPSSKKISLALHKPYFLYVGTIQPRKNIEKLIEAFALYHVHHPDSYLYIVGKKGWLSEKIYAKAQGLGLNDYVIFPGYVTDDELEQYYLSAECFVFPSLYEGFGMPILEAMSYGCPVISSFASSLPEVGGEACLYFDPQDTKGIAQDMQDIVENKKLKRELVQKGKKRVQLFSWTKAGEETLALLKQYANTIKG